MGKKRKQFEQDVKTCTCSECHETIYLEHFVEKGDLIYCDECSSQFIVQRLKPPKLALVTDLED